MEKIKSKIKTPSVFKYGESLYFLGSDEAGFITRNPAAVRKALHWSPADTKLVLEKGKFEIPLAFFRN